MRTSKCVVVLLIVTLAGTAAWGAASNTRFASCIVRITVDPAIIPLNVETVQGLLRSSAVAGRAAREVLAFDMRQDASHELIAVQWLNVSLVPMSPAAGSSRQQEDKASDEELRRQLEEIYGAPSRRDSAGSTKEEQGDAVQEKATRRSSYEGKAAGGMGGMMSGMGGMGAYGGPMGGMGGMGGMMSGMGGMGAYGGMMGEHGGMGFYGAPLQGTGMGQSATIKLDVSLPESVEPKAEEFLKELVGNLRSSLSYAYEVHLSDLRDSLHSAEGLRQRAQAALEAAADDASPATRKAKEQLSTVVNLSVISPQMPISEAVDALRKAVEPPLNIVVLWNDLSMNLRVEPTTPANIDGMPRIRLETALDLLVKGLPNRLGKAGPIWKIKDDVIVIGTLLTLEESRASARKPDVETDVRALAAQRTELTRKVQNLELDLASMDARREAIGKQIVSIERQVDQKLSRDTVTQELEKLAQIHTKTTTDAQGRSISADSPEAREKVIRARIELASRREELSRQAGGGQLEEFNKELSRMAVDQAEQRAQLGILNDQLQGVQKQLAQASVFDPQAARIRIAQEALDIAERRIAELQRRISNLQPPMVTMIGAN